MDNLRISIMYIYVLVHKVKCFPHPHQNNPQKNALHYYHCTKMLLDSAIKNSMPVPSKIVKRIEASHAFNLHNNIVQQLIQSYASVKALRPADVRSRLASIDRSSIEGLRDYAILAVTLATRRRVAEIATLRWRDVRIEGTGCDYTLPEPRAGDARRRAASEGWPRPHKLPSGSVRRQAWRPGTRCASLGAARPSGRAARGPRGALTGNHQPRPAGGHFQGLRHTFAHAMEDSGAKLTTIQRRLGHSSAATTSRSLERRLRAGS